MSKHTKGLTASEVPRSAHDATLGKYIRLSGPVTSGDIIVTTTDISGG